MDGPDIAAGQLPVPCRNKSGAMARARAGRAERPVARSTANGMDAAVPRFRLCRGVEDIARVIRVTDLEIECLFVDVRR